MPQQGKIDVGQPADYLKKPPVLDQTCLHSLGMARGYVSLPLASVDVDNQIVPRPVAFALVTCAIGAWAGRVALNP